MRAKTKGLASSFVFLQIVLVVFSFVFLFLFLLACLLACVLFACVFLRWLKRREEVVEVLSEGEFLNEEGP